MSENNKSLVCAITGGIGSGKTTVSSLIRELGYPVISSDNNAKLIIRNNEKVKQKLINEFGEMVFTDNGEINNTYLSSLVFGHTAENEKNLLKLNTITHPPVIELMMAQVEEFEKKGEPVIFVESALTYEAGLEEGFDYIIVVDANEDIAIERAINRSGLSAIEIKHRMNQQIPPEAKKNQADFVIENNGSLDDLKKSVDFIIEIIKQML